MTTRRIDISKPGGPPQEARKSRVEGDKVWWRYTQLFLAQNYWTGTIEKFVRSSDGMFHRKLITGFETIHPDYFFWDYVEFVNPENKILAFICDIFEKSWKGLKRMVV